MNELDTLAKTSGATHKDSRQRGRYYRYNSWIKHCEVVNIDIHDEEITWHYYGSKLPETAVRL